MNPRLQRYIETEIIPRYEAFDKAHRTDHVRMVITRSLILGAHYNVDPDMVYTIAAYHDTGLAVERERHHIISGEILMRDEHLKNWFTEDCLAIMRDAVEDHRASSDHTPRTLYGCIVAEADRLIDPETIVRRTIQYGLAHTPELDRAGHFDRMCKHLQNKYAEDGYLRLWIPKSDNAAHLEALRVLIRDQKRLSDLFDTIYDAESNV